MQSIISLSHAIDYHQNGTNVNRTRDYHHHLGKIKESFNFKEDYVKDLKYSGTDLSKYESFVQFEKELSTQFEMEDETEIINFIFNHLSLMNIIQTVEKMIKEYLGENLVLGLKLAPGDMYHENILQVSINGFNPHNTDKYFELEEKLLNCLNRDDLNKIQLFLEY